MTETQRRIRAYKKALPELRERVIAVALLLAMSASMLGTASFAWITLSTAPEASGMATTVAANGNLEIALAKGSTSDPLEKPDESQVGDSSAKQGIVNSNVTWGNLVNVSDPVYGLSNIALRPALLSDYNLSRYPLYGASYGEDGRVVDTTNKYEYASWKDFGGGEYRFAAGDEVQYGVRAIASVGRENVTGNTLLAQYMSNAETAYNNSRSIYYGLVRSDDEATKLVPESGTPMTAIEALKGLVKIFAQNRVDDGDDSYSQYIWYFYRMMEILRDVLDQEAIALMNLANLQLYLKDPNADLFETPEELTSKTAAQVKAMGINLTTFEQYKSNVADLQYCLDGMAGMAEECKHPDSPNLPEYKWASISPYINKLVDINKATIKGGSLDTTPLGSLGTKAALGLLGVKDAVIIVTEGVLKDTEQRIIDTANRVEAYVTISVNYIVTATVGGTVTTAASGSPTCANDLQYCYDLAEGGSGGEGEAVAKDTYGMALDVWVRTNYPDAVLTLEGSAVYEQQRAIGKDAENNTVELSTLVVEDAVLDVYQKDGKWYFADNHEEVPQDALKNSNPVDKYDDIIVGYRGENRIWEDWETMLENGFIEKDATTQGSGSCFVFYADTPTEQEKIKEMLAAFTVAFVDESGTVLGTAALNMEHAYANQGKVTVPLEVVSGVSYTDEDGTGKVGIARLAQNAPKMITAVVYLNGMYLKNENVLASGELQGQLNIQFGTNSVLVAPDNEELMGEYRTITATVSVNNQTTTNEQITLPYKVGGYTANVSLSIDGRQPEKISGFFVRVINTTQGSRGEEVSFTLNAETGVWTADFLLENPGNYVLNTLLVDGVQYNLHDGTAADHPANHPKIYIEGLELGSVTTPGVTTGTYMTTDSTFPIQVNAEIKTAMAVNQVIAQFFSADNSKQYNAILTRSGNTNLWTGETSINESGTFTLKYITVDGQVLEVPMQSQTTVTLFLGLQTDVYTTLGDGTIQLLLVDGQEKPTAPFFARVYDSEYQPQTNLTNVKLYYHERGSSADYDGWEIPLVWDGSYYSGEIQADREGVYSFDRLMVGSNALYNANTSPVFAVTTMAMPEYLSGSAAAATQLAISNPAKVTVKISNAATATVTGTFTRQDGNGETMEVVAVKEGDSFVFNLQQDGQWKLTDLYVDKGESIFQGSIAVKNEIVTKVIATVHPEVMYNGTTYYNGTTDTDAQLLELSSDTCLGTQTSGAVSVVAKDYSGDLISGLSGAVWHFDHVIVQRDSAGNVTRDIQKEYSGYSGIAVNSWDADGITVDETAATATMTEQFIYGGEYPSVISLNFTDAVTGNHGWTLSAGSPRFAVKSALPTIKITDVSTKEGTNSTVLTGTRADDGTVDYNTDMTGDFFRHSDYSAVVYITVNPDWRLSATLPEVELTLSNMTTNAFNASVTFENESTAEQNKTYTFKQNELVKSNTIGYKEDGGTLAIVTWSPKLFPAGKDTVEFISVTYGDKTFDVALSNPVTINQPQYPPYAEFVISDDEFTTPARVYSEDGESINIKFPVLADIPVVTTSTSGGDYGDPISGPTTAYTNTYTRSGGGWFLDPYKYKKINVTTTIYEKTSTLITTTNLHRITGWVINGESYEPGTYLEVTGNVVVNATTDIITTTESEYTKVRRTVKIYSQENETRTEPSGTMVNSVPSNTDVEEKVE